MRYFVCKLYGPRPSFPVDITPEETALMQEHAKYWRAQMEEHKRVVVFGPVADPAGVYGILILQLPEGEAPEPLLHDDPVIKANRGFRFDCAPMIQAVLPT